MAIPRLGHVIDSLDISGGAEKQLIANLRAFDHAAMHHEVVLIRASPDSRIREVPDQVRLQTLYPEGAVPNRIQIASRLRRLAIDQGYDLIHASLPDSALAARYVGLTTRVLAVESLVNISHERIRCRDNAAVTPTKLMLHTQLDRVTMRGLDRFHAVSNAVAESWAETVGLNRGMIDVIPRGIDTAHIPSVDALDPAERSRIRAELGVEDHDFLVLSVGRVEPQKGHRYLLEAADEIRREIPGLKVAIVGRAGNSSRAIAQLVAERDLGDIVRMPGPRRDIVKVMAASDIFAFPSLFEGNGGNALIEAMAVGLPVVTSRAAPMTDFVHDGKNGLLATRADPHEVGAAILTLAQDEGLRRRLALAARTSAGGLPSPEKIAERFENWYRLLLDRTHPSSA